MSQDVVRVKAPIITPPKKPDLIQRIKLIFRKFINMPLPKKIIDKFNRINRKNKLIGIVICGIVIVLMVVCLQIVAQTSKETDDTKITQRPILTKGTPTFTTILPSGKNISTLGGWTRISPPKADPVFTYIDKIGNVQINVSEQPLPYDFKTDTARAVEKLAQNEKADEKVTVGDTLVYIGTSADGPQSVIFSKNNLLILIKSDTRITDDQWTKYINTLQ